MNDIQRARKNRWWKCFLIEIRVSWPTDVIGWIWAALLFLMPIGLMVLSIKAANRLVGRSDDSSDGDAA